MQSLGACRAVSLAKRSRTGEVEGARAGAVSIGCKATDATNVDEGRLPRRLWADPNYRFAVAIGASPSQDRDSGRRFDMTLLCETSGKRMTTIRDDVDDVRMRLRAADAKRGEDEASVKDALDPNRVRVAFVQSALQRVEAL